MPGVSLNILFCFVELSSLGQAVCSKCKDEQEVCSSLAPQSRVRNGTLGCNKELTWYTADVRTSAAFLEGREAGVDNMRLGVVADAAAESLLLSLQHGRQVRVRQALHNDALHERTPIVVLDVPHPLQTRRLLINGQLQNP